MNIPGACFLDSTNEILLCERKLGFFRKSFLYQIRRRNIPPEVFFEKDALKRCGKFTSEQSCPSVISIKPLCNFIEITLRHGCSPVNLLHIFRIPFYKNSSGGMLLKKVLCRFNLNITSLLLRCIWISHLVWWLSEFCSTWSLTVPKRQKVFC